ncbi:hypothetical protein [Polluticoccus soli]|uniref:hypothetical protein n=1 Tax=Polluticoccus soli TaxID=3034150 RepID=UPI0023E2C2DB|nr:hypothetical protein [Flavipsychrobacter sp. JY13-12]
MSNEFITIARDTKSKQAIRNEKGQWLMSPSNTYRHKRLELDWNEVKNVFRIVWREYSKGSNYEEMATTFKPAHFKGLLSHAKENALKMQDPAIRTKLMKALKEF